MGRTGFLGEFSNPANICQYMTSIVLPTRMRARVSFQLESAPMASDYDHAFSDGLAVAATLMQAGATADEIGVLLDKRPAGAGLTWRILAAAGDYQRRRKGQDAPAVLSVEQEQQK
jgi:hypothetical protein